MADPSQLSTWYMDTPKVKYKGLYEYVFAKFKRIISIILDDHLIAVIGGEVQPGIPLNNTEIIPLPMSFSAPRCRKIDT